jgi:hypothetical protein
MTWARNLTRGLRGESGLRSETDDWRRGGEERAGCLRER